MSKIAYVFREDAEPELRWLHHVVPRGGTAIDLGAHYGDYTLALSTLVGTNGHVVAVEPMRHALEVLHRNISINDADNVHVEPVGVGRTKARAVLHHHSDPSRASLGQMDEDGRTEEIEITTLDEIVDRLGLERVDYVKLDIEGSEFDALEGGRTMLEQFRPVVQFEQQPRAAERLGHAPENVWDMLADLGYAFAALDDRGVLRQVDDPERWGPNFFAIPDRLPIEVLISA
jgi:FkbM family methyltransferase